MSGWAAGAMVGSALIGGIASNKAAKKANASQQAALDANQWQGDIAKAQWDDYKTTYQPLEHKMIGDVQKYDSAEARNAAAAEAQATVSSEIGKAAGRLSRTVGFDPSSAAAQAAQSNLALSGAAMGATAQNAARQKVKDTAYGRQLDMLGMGKGLVANASTGFANTASNASAIANSQQNMANGQANAAGTLTGTLIGGLSKVDWSKFGSGGGAGTGSNAGYISNDLY